MKKLLGILVLGLLWCNMGFADILELKCSQDYERLPGKSEFEKYWLPKDKFFYKFDLEKRRLIEIGYGKNRKDESADVQYWKNKETNDELIRGVISGGGKDYYKKMQHRIMAFTITKSTKKKYSHELINFPVTKNLLNKWENSSNKTYQALEEEIDFTNEFITEASGVVKGKCKVLN